MLQIIGWLGCFYLFFRSLQMGQSKEFHNEEGKMNDASLAVMLLGIAASIGFAFWLGVQGEAFPALGEEPVVVGDYDTGLTQSEIACVNNAEPNEVLACID